MFWVQPQWWEPVIWWIRRTSWTEHDIKDRQGHYERAHRRRTWLEMCHAFQVQTGYHFPGDKLDLESQEKMFRYLCCKVSRGATFMQGPEVIPFRAAWNEAEGISSAKPIIGILALEYADDRCCTPA